MSEEILDKQIVTYSNHFEFNGWKLAFKKKLLFNITGIPCLINRTDGGWWVNRKLLTESKVKELVKHEPVEIDISDLQWYVQERIKGCFDLD